MYNEFVSQLVSQLSLPLPGEEAQYRMAPSGRPLAAQLTRDTTGYRNSSVLILLYPHEGSMYTVLLKRHDYQGVHSGQVGFPGGKQDETDATLEDTALREAHEETGLERNKVAIIGQLTRLFIPVSKFMVQPFVGVTPVRPDFIPDPFEVKQLLEVKLDVLLDKRTIAYDSLLQKNGLKIKTPYYAVDGHLVWGATAMIISELTVVLEEMKKDK